MNFGGEPSSGASDGLPPTCFKAPVPSGCTFTVVLSMQTLSTLICMIPSCCNPSNTRCSTPFLLHLFSRVYTVCHFPYRSGNALHLQPFSATYNTALISSRFSIFTFPLCFGRYFSIFLYCSFVISILLFYHFPVLL